MLNHLHGDLSIVWLQGKAIGRAPIADAQFQDITTVFALRELHLSLQKELRFTSCFAATHICMYCPYRTIHIVPRNQWQLSSWVELTQEQSRLADWTLCEHLGYTSREQTKSHNSGKTCRMQSCTTVWNFKAPWRRPSVTSVIFLKTNKGYKQTSAMLGHNILSKPILQSKCCLMGNKLQETALFDGKIM